MGKASRDKGKRGEREAAAELGELLGVDARRGAQHKGGPDSPDVQLDGAAIHVEAKRAERLSLYAAMTQADVDAPQGSVPIVWHRPNGADSVVILWTSDLVRLAREVVRVVDERHKVCGFAAGGGTPPPVGE